MAHTNAVLCLCYITEKRIVSADMSIKLWDLTKEISIKTINGAHKSSLNSLISSIKLWNLNTGMYMRKLLVDNIDCLATLQKICVHFF